MAHTNKMLESMIRSQEAKKELQLAKADNYKKLATETQKKIDSMRVALSGKPA
jgi:hypothetical protein